MTTWLVARCADRRNAGRQLAGVIALVLALAVAAPLAPVHAEILDFDPFIDEVPEILTPDEILLLERAQSGGFVYMTTDLSPNGAYVQGVGGLAGFGFIDLETGELMPLQAGAPGYPVTESRWVSDTILAQLSLEEMPGAGDEPPTYNYYWVRYDAATGDVITATFDAGLLDGEILSAGMSMSEFLVMKLPAAAPAARSVQLAPSYELEPLDVPEGLPGRVGAPVVDTIELQQAGFSLALVGPDGGDRRELLSLPEESGVDGISWSRDGTLLAIVTRTMPDWQEGRPRRNEPVLPGTPNLNSINVREALGLVPPGENPLVVGSYIHVFDVATGDEVATFAGADFEQGLLVDVSFAPSGSSALLRIAVRSELDDRANPVYSSPSGLEYHLLDESLGATRRIEVAGSESLAAGAGFATDEEIVFVVPDETNQRIVMYDVASDAATTVWDKPGAVMQYLQRGQRRVFSHSTSRSPWELWSPVTTPDVDAWDARPVTAYSAMAAELGAALAYEDVTWRASDGAEMHGVYVHEAASPYPPEEPGPLVVWQQGGPGGQMVNDYGGSVEAPYSVLPHYGLPVLIANAAGRNVKATGFYSALADGDNFGQLDIAQIKEGVEHLVDQGVVHPQRVGITGCSYGGYFTLQSMRTYPGFYAAGNPQCSLVDLTEEFTFGYTPIVGYLMGRSPTADPFEYLRDSPMYGIKDVDVPVLIFHGTDDFLPVALMNNIHDDLEERGVDVQFLRMANEGHGYGFPESQNYAGQLQIEFFRKHLVDAEVDPWPPPGRTIYMPAGYRGVEP